MEAYFKRDKNDQPDRNIRQCRICLYLMREEGGSEKEKCFRFVRFVDHMLNDNSRDCEYWQQTERCDI